MFNNCNQEYLLAKIKNLQVSETKKQDEIDAYKLKKKEKKYVKYAMQKVMATK